MNKVAHLSVWLLLVCVFGCQETTEQVKKSVPKPPSFAESVDKLKDHATKIKDAFASGKKGDAHGSLHVVPGVLKQLSNAIETTDLSSEVSNELKGAVQKLENAFQSLDGDLHGKGEKDIEEVGASIDEAIETLESNTNAFNASK